MYLSELRRGIDAPKRKVLWMKTLFHVKGVPFFSVGGQVNNSTPYSAEKVETVFSHVKDFGLNTVAAPVY